MKNSITVGIEFSYRGESYSPSASVDLDAIMEKGGDLADLHAFLAVQHNIDTYSYLYEVMESHEISFSNASGLAADCLDNGQFDIQKFRQLWQEQQELGMLADIAKRHMHIEDLSRHEDLKRALLEAYEAGRSA